MIAPRSHCHEVLPEPWNTIKNTADHCWFTKWPIETSEEQESDII